MKKILLGVAAAAVVVASPAYAAPVIADGTVSSAHLFVPTVLLTTNPSTYGAFNGTTFQTSGTGGYANAAGGFGVLNGTIQFSQIVGTTLAQTLANLFTFSNGSTSDFYKFSADSVTTRSFVNTPGVSSSGSLFLTGVVNASGFVSTPSSLTLSFNSTGNSAYSSSATLQTPISAAVPEPATWAMMMLGFGMVGFGLRSRRNGKVTTKVAFA